MFELVATPDEPERVLVVDDEETIRNLLALVVERAGAQSDFANNGQAALALLDDQEYALALLDKNLPDMTGLELLAKLKSRHPDTQAFIITGHANTESAILALRLGAFDYILKPFELEVVTDRIRIALEQRRLRRRLATLLEELTRQNAELAQARQEAARAYMEAVTRLSLAAELSDPDAQGHIQRVSRYAAILARGADAPQVLIDHVLDATPLHDVGMIAVTDRIRRKKDPLTVAERGQMQEHVEIGAQILEGSKSDVLAIAREIILTHHEKWDGNGYPRGLAGERIPLSGRIVALADAWDALTTDRVYRRALPHERALAEIRHSAGTHFDPHLVEVFVECLPQILAVAEDSSPSVRAALESDPDMRLPD